MTVSGAGHKRRILLATDGSPAARRVVIIAAELAAPSSAELTALHVLSANVYRLARLGPVLAVSRVLNDPLDDSALLEARRLARERGVSPCLLLISGEPREVIVRVTARLPADLIALGLRDRWPDPGNLTWWVERHSVCPVLAVPLQVASKDSRRRRAWLVRARAGATVRSVRRRGRAPLTGRDDACCVPRATVRTRMPHEPRASTRRDRRKRTT